MSKLVELLSPRFTDDEQVPAKQMQRGYSFLRDQMMAQGRLVVTVHGSPEAVMLPYQDLKALWNLVQELADRAENSTLLELAAERLKTPRSERIPLEQGLAEMQELIRNPSHE